MTKPKITTATAIAGFLQSARARNCSAKYIGKLTYTLSFLTNATTTLPTTPGEIEQILAPIAARNLSDETYHEIWASMRRLYSWTAERLGTPNPMTYIQRPRRRTKLPRVHSREQLDQLLDANADRPRETALISLIIDGMARVGEVWNLTWNHIEVSAEGTTAHLPHTGKTGARSVPLRPETLYALRRAATTHNLWTTQEDTPLTFDGVREVLKRAHRRARLQGTAHILRHTAATQYVRNGGDLFSLMRIGGWSTLKSVMMYVHLANSDVREKHARYGALAHRSAGRQLTLLPTADGGQQ